MLPSGTNMLSHTILLKTRRTKVFLYIAQCFVAVTASAAGPNLVWDGIQNPGIRTALFDSYQGRHFKAITQLLAEQKLGRVKKSYEQAGLVLGGLYLSYGFHREAANTFENLLEKNQPQEVSDKAWFYLAKTQFHRGRLSDALKALSKIKGGLPIVMQEDRITLNAIILISQGEYKQATQTLEKLKNRSDWYAFGRYNLGVALYKAGEELKGIEILEDIGSLSTSTKEMRSLKNKANLTLAYTFLENKNQPENAIAYLQKIELEGQYSNEALLSLGRAYSNQKKYKKSLVPWLKLIERKPSDPSVQAGLMAVPYAFGQLDAYKQSLEYYEIAMRHFQKEIEKINKAAEAIAGGKLIEGLIRTRTGESVEGIWTIKNVLQTPEGEYLWQLMAGNKFRESLFNYTQLRLSLGKLEGWSATIDTVENLSDKRVAAYKARILQLQSKVLVTAERVHHLLQKIAFDELDIRKQRLITYFNEARFSVAQIYDYAAKRWEDG